MKQILKRFTVALASSMATLGLMAPVASASSVGPWNNHHNWSHDYGIEINADVDVLSHTELTPLVEVHDWSGSSNWSGWHHADNNLIDVDADVDVLDGNLLEADVDADVGGHNSWHHEGWNHHNHGGGLLDVDLDLDLL